MTTAARNETKAKRRSELGVEARIAQLEESVERLKANQRLLEQEVTRLRGMLLLVKR
jgi:uncharacterized small protein (DUF1192 family)